MIGEDGKKYKQTEGIISNGFKVTLEFPEEACKEKSISIDLILFRNKKASKMRQKVI